jgi:DnaJ domain
LTQAAKTRERFHGRVRHGEERNCNWEGCQEPGEFRAPRGRDAPRAEDFWFCLDHVRQYNEAWDWFSGMSAEQIREAQRPGGMDAWRRQTEAAARAEVQDPLDLLDPAVRAMHFARAKRAASGKPLRPQDISALQVLGLDESVSRAAMAKRYKELVRQLHPDANGGDRSGEKRLSKIIEAYTHLRRSPAFSS